MADRHHFEKPLNCHNSAVVRRIAMKFGMTAHFDFLKVSDRQKFHFLTTKMVDDPCPDVRGRYTQNDPAGHRTSMVQMPMRFHIGTTWRIRLNLPCMVVMQLYVKQATIALDL